MGFGERVNLNNLAKEISKREGKKRQVDITQIKEILSHLCDILAEEDYETGRSRIYTKMLSTGYKNQKHKDV